MKQYQKRKEKSRDKVLRIRMHEQSKQKLESIAKALDVSMSALVRMAIVEFERNHKLCAMN